MYCDRCGTPAGDRQRFCGSCGKAFADVPPAAPVPARPDMNHHFRMLSIFWMVASALLLIPGFALMGWGFHTHRAWNVAWPVLGAAGTAFSLIAVLGLLAGWGLAERATWARPLAIVLAIFSLLKFPIGTALGAYTLWALAGQYGSAEYERMSRR